MSIYKDKKSLVIYFSRADENYAVGYIDKGNTEYIAEYVRDVPKDIKRICVGANVLDDAIAIKGTDCKNAKSIIENWI